MRIMFAVVVMGMVVMFAAALVAVQVVVSLLPLIVAALIVVGVVRLSNRHPLSPVAGAPPSAWAPAPVAWPAVPPVPPSPVGWLLVPVWQWPSQPAGTRQLPVIDAEVISEDLTRG